MKKLRVYSLELIVLFLTLLFSNFTYAVVAPDVSSSSSCNGCTTLTWAHTVTGTNTLIIGTAHGLNEPCCVTDFTYNSVSMDSVGSSPSPSTPGVDVYRKAGVATGSHNCEITLSYGDVTVGTCTSFTGVDPVTPLGSLVAVDNGPLDSGSVTVPSDGMAYAVAIWASGASGCAYTATPQDGGMTALVFAGAVTQICQTGGGGTTDVIAFGSTRTTTGSFVYNDGSDNWPAMLAVPINSLATATLVRHRPIFQ